MRRSYSRFLTAVTVFFLCLTPLLLTVHAQHDGLNGDGCALCLIAQHLRADLLQPVIQVPLSTTPVASLVDMENLLLSPLFDADSPIRAPPTSTLHFS